MVKLSALAGKRFRGVISAGSAAHGTSIEELPPAHSITSSARPSSGSGDGEGERLRRPEVYDELDFHQLLHRHISRLLAFEDTAGVNPRVTVQVRKSSSIAHKAPSRGEPSKLKDRRDRIANRQRSELFGMTDE